LTKAGGLVSGRCDFRFKLWTAPSGGQQAGVTVEKTNVALNNSNFTVNLDFGEGVFGKPATFSGSARWLSVGVRCPAGSGGYASLGGRMALNPAPYALSLRPGATIEGSPASGSVLTGEYTGSGASSALRGFNVSSVGTGVYGWARATSGTNYGVYGRTNSVAGYGVYGEAHHASGGIGVYGFSATGHGVHGKANAPDGYAIYSEGNTHIEGVLSWKGMTSFVAIPVSAFIPEQLHDAGNVAYDNEGYYLKNESNADEWYTAPVQLPHGAVIKSLQVGWRDGSDYSASLFLSRNPHRGRCRPDRRASVCLAAPANRSAPTRGCRLDHRCRSDGPGGACIPGQSRFAAAAHSPLASRSRSTRCSGARRGPGHRAGRQRAHRQT